MPLLIGAFRASGAAAVVDDRGAIKRRRRGLTASELVEGLFAPWAAGGERCEDLGPLREDAAPAPLQRPRPAGAADGARLALATGPPATRPA